MPSLNDLNRSSGTPTLNLSSIKSENQVEETLNFSTLNTKEETDTLVLPKKTADYQKRKIIENINASDMGIPLEGNPTRRMVDPSRIVETKQIETYDIVDNILGDADEAIERRGKELEEAYEERIYERELQESMNEVDSELNEVNQYNSYDDEESYEKEYDSMEVEYGLNRSEDTEYVRSKNLFEDTEEPEDNISFKDEYQDIAEEELEKEEEIIMKPTGNEDYNVEEPKEEFYTSEQLEAEENVVELEESPVKMKAPYKAKPLEDAPEDTSSFVDLDDEDFKELEEDDSTDNSSKDPLEDENMKELQKQITVRVKKTTSKLDISTFSIASKAVAYQHVVKDTRSDIRTTDWVLMSSNRHIAFKAFSGTELEKINPQNNGRNTLQGIRSQWQEIYEHVVDPFKAKSMEAWTKSIRYTDINHIYMGIYVSNFLDSNFIPYSCPHCQNMFLSDNISILDMVKYKDNAAKEKFKRLYEADFSEGSDRIPAEVIPVSDTIAVAIKNPSIYDVLFETSALDQKFREKYEQVLALMVYIDNIYMIDAEHNTLVPVGVKLYPNNLAKNVKSKVITYSKILGTLTADEYSIIQACIRTLVETNEELTYEIPEATCTKCGTVIPKEERQASEILFTRHQLAALATM